MSLDCSMKPENPARTPHRHYLSDLCLLLLPANLWETLFNLCCCIFTCVWWISRAAPLFSSLRQTAAPTWVMISKGLPDPGPEASSSGPGCRVKQLREKASRACMCLLRAVVSQPSAGLRDPGCYLKHASGQKQAYTPSTISVCLLSSLLSHQALME